MIICATPIYIEDWRICSYSLSFQTGRSPLSTQRNICSSSKLTSWMVLELQRNRTSRIVLEFRSAKAVHNIIKVQRFPKELWFVLLFKYIIPISSTNRFTTLSYWCNSYRLIYEVTWVFWKGCIFRDRNVAIIMLVELENMIHFTGLYTCM